MYREWRETRIGGLLVVAEKSAIVGVSFDLERASIDADEARGPCVGRLSLAAGESVAKSATFVERAALTESSAPVERALVERAFAEIDAYLSGSLRSFSLPLAPRGTEFMRRAWDALLEIPYGETRSYGEIARAIGKPGAARAVGMANNRNPIAILIPCHRVIGADGSLVGYAPGLALKRALLELEGSLP
jgi:methylated-DNA-[protein]-cysteine S-methyltransferase